MTTIRDILNTAKWSHNNLHQLSLVVTHRGALGGRRSVLGSRIEEITGDGVHVEGDTSTEGAFLPYHRIIELRDDDGALVWDRESGLHALPVAVRAHAPESTSTNSASAVHHVEVVVSRTESGHDMLTIDGSAGEGGGQILRSSLTLSMITGQPFRLVNIRAGRRKPGLKRQHVTCVQAAAAICGAEVEGASLHSSELCFRPGELRGGEYSFDVGTAGSVALVLQTIAAPLALATQPSTVRIAGGTHARWAPPLPFVLDAWLPWMHRVGVGLKLKMTRAGFFPAGGGEVVATFDGGSALKAHHATFAAAELELEAHAVVSNLSEGIARRELLALESAISFPMTLHAGTLRSPGPGNACWLIAWGDTENVFSAIGEKNTPAEDVAAQVAAQFEAWHAAKVSVDEHLADQLLLPLALAGGGSFTTTKPSLHTWTNIAVIAAFGLPRFEVVQHGEVFELRATDT